MCGERSVLDSNKSDIVPSPSGSVRNFLIGPPLVLRRIAAAP